MTKYIIILFILLVGMSSCRHKDGDVTPRRYAYPRIEAYDSTYRRLTVGPVSIEVNAAAATSSPKDGWLDIHYPRYGATVYLSATHTDDLSGALANRRQRISLNLGGAKAVTHNFVSGDFDCEVVESVDAGATPVQILAVSPKGLIISGSANISGTTTPADSIRPIVTALTRDAIHILMSIK